MVKTIKVNYLGPNNELTGGEWFTAQKHIKDYIEWCDQEGHLPHFDEMFSVAVVNLMREEPTFTRDKRQKLYELMKEKFDA